MPECWVNIEVTGYLNIEEVTNRGEEVSIKLRGGAHNEDCPDSGSCYIIGVKYNGKVNSQFEEPHDNNNDMVFTPAGLQTPNSMIGKWFGVKGIVYLQGDHDKNRMLFGPRGT